MEKFNPAKQKQKPANLKSPTVNILINAAIFLLVAVIIFMAYSLYLKFSYKAEAVPEEPKGAEDIIQVEVRNGCGVSGVADRYTDFLRSKSFDVADIGNFVSSEVDQTMVIDRIGNMANAYKVAKSLGVKNENVLQQLNKDYFIDVSVVIGKDYFSLTPFK